MSGASDFIHLNSPQTSLILQAVAGQRASIVYFGPSLAETAEADLMRLATRQHAPGTPDQPLSLSLMNDRASGVSAAPGLSAHRNGKAWLQALITVETCSDRTTARIVTEDVHAHIRLVHQISLCPKSDVVTCHTVLTNLGTQALSVEACAVLCLPVPQQLDRMRGLSGRWANEFQMEEVPVFMGSYLRENRRGRTSHDSFPALIAGAQETTETNGPCQAFHLGWSGNHTVRVDRIYEGQTILQMGELFLPGEVSLAPGEDYQSPKLHFAQSDQGYSALSQKFHAFLRSGPLGSRLKAKPRPIHYNTWEAVYFDHDQDRLFALARKAAEIGAERFILDDGWFRERRHDRAGLGDWSASAAVYPDGLGPLINHVTGLGMEFGLWLEPEMVNPDSDLYRAHPDWVLQGQGVEQISSRHQYVLDLTRSEVQDYLFMQISALLSAYEITYLKWDMNRDIHHPGNQTGRAVASAQTKALYALIDRIRAAYPAVEIESCASGGGRADYGILERTDRIWTSDSNDALDRQIIQRGASHFFPPEVMGAHVGPAKCHITGRRLSMELRVATAFFGHMGMELNLLDESESDLAILKAGLALHKAHRSLIHAGHLVRLKTPKHACAFGILSAQRDEALFSWCNLLGHAQTLPPKLTFEGLDPKRQYRLSLIWPTQIRTSGPASVLEAADLLGNGRVFAGNALRHQGLQLPLLYPETAMIFHLQSV